MTHIKLIKHLQGAPGLRFFGLGPHLMPTNGITKLQVLFNEHAFWAKNREKHQLRKMLANSTVVISIWNKKRLVGFGRATSDKIYRAVLWDIVVADDLQGTGLGRLVVQALLKAAPIKKVEKIYLMTTNGSEFYEQMDFEISSKQKLLFLKQKPEI